MRTAALLLALLPLAGCIPSVDPPNRSASAPPPSAQRSPAPPSAATRQCHADLDRAGIGYTPLPDRHFGGGCTAIGAVQLTQIGTPVSNLGAMTCPLARAFAAWVNEAVQPAAIASFGARVARIQSFGTYACRTVNGRPGGKLSEHARSNAVDIAAFELADGRRVSVESGWHGDEDSRRFLRAVHRAACRRFQVVLGPDADAAHRDHFHFDLGNGPYCR
ncbi:MAG: extensin family protein [Sphingomonadaceae bacterium]